MSEAHQNEQPAPPARRLFTPKEAAAILGVTEDQLRHFVRHGEMSYIAVGRGAKKMRRMFEQEDIDKFIAGRRRKDQWPKYPGPSKRARGRRSSDIDCGSVDETFMSRLKRRRAERRSATSASITSKPKPKPTR
jgi:excisionase family DNA binding protein